MFIDAATYKMNKLRLPLFVLVCIDGNGESEIVAFWVVSDESKETLADMVQILKKKFKKHNLFHVLRNFKREVTCEKLKISANVRLHALEILQKLAYCKLLDAYDQLYQELQDADSPTVLNITMITGMA